MDLFRLPMKGGNVDFTNNYQFVTLAELATKSVANSLKSPTGDNKNATSALIIVKNNSQIPPVIQDKNSLKDTNKAVLDNVIGMSWYAALKLINEFIPLDVENETARNPSDILKEFAEKFFLINSNRTDEEKAKYKAKVTIIGFIHGVHAYALYKEAKMPEPKMPEPKMPEPTKDNIVERFNAVKEYIRTLEGEDKGIIEGLWQALVNLNLNISNDESKPQFILGTEKGIEDFLKTTPQQEQEAASIASDEDLDDIAYAFDIYDALLNFKDDE